MKNIYRFSKTGCDWDGALKDDKAKDVLGGKGASLVTMCGSLGLNVPPGFTITTEVCNAYRSLKTDSARKQFRQVIMDDVATHLEWLKEQFGYMPLLSVRSGAPISMPGMMDTILNVGMNNKIAGEWIERIGEKAALDSYRRLIQMMGHTAYGVPAEVFEFQLAKVKKNAGVKLDAELDAVHLNGVLIEYIKAFHGNTDLAFPQALEEQLEDAIVAVFKSWDNPRAIEYRKQNKISDDMGTAVTVQAMVFGNMGEDSGSGVLFTRNPSTGAKKIMGEYLSNAQGEDVVAGIRTPDDLSKYVVEAQHKMGTNIAWASELVPLCEKLEEEYKDMVDVEFTVQKGELFILQSRAGKRSAAAAFRIAVDLVEEGVIEREEALTRLTRNQFKIVRKPTIDPTFKAKPMHTGLPACPGVAVGKPVFSSVEAVACGVPCILVTHETTPDDIAGMAKAVGILTQTGGATSHAAVVARAMDKPCIVGCTELSITALQATAAKTNMSGPSTITIDGGTGKVWVGIDVPVIDSSDKPEVKTVMSWCMEALGWYEQTVVDQEQGDHRIMAAHWWDDMDVGEAVLGSLAEMPSRSHVILDLASPEELQHKDDFILDSCFGSLKAPSSTFRLAVIHDILERELKGLTLVNHNMDSGHPNLIALKKKGIIVLGQVNTVADMLEGAGEVSKDFIEKVIGGMSYYEQLKMILKQAGIKQKAVQRAAPADYAAFTVLAK